MRFTGVLFPVEIPRVTMDFSATWTRWYSHANPHRGVDIAPYPGSAGAPVRAPLSGVVTHAGTHPAAGRELVITGTLPYSWGAVDLRGDYVSFRALEPFHIRMTHHSRLVASQGERVDAGDVVALVGSSGANTTGPHVHLEVRKGDYAAGRVVNPLHLFVAAIPGLREQLIMT